MSINLTHQYNPELFNLIVSVIPLLCKSKRDVIIFFKGAGVSQKILSDLSSKVENDRQNITKYEIVRTIILRLNERGDRELGVRREILKRITGYENFSTCWPNDQLKAKGLVAEISQLINVKDSFTRMNQEKDKERKKNQEQREIEIQKVVQRENKIKDVKKKFALVFAIEDPQRRGVEFESALNDLFAAYDMLVRTSFTRKGDNCEGVIEQVDGVIEIDCELYLVEAKWYSRNLGVPEVSQHIVRVSNRESCRGLLISFSDFAPGAIQTVKESLSQNVFVLCPLQHILKVLEEEGNLLEMLRARIRATVVDKQPLLNNY